jgi:probable phosphoglycerate mutase
VSRSVYIALVRHAPTEWNAAGRLQGRRDVPLSAEGAAQAARWRLPGDLAGLQAIGRLAWAASPLQRAVVTAHALGAAAPHVEPRLVERDYGTWQGLTAGELEPHGPEDGWDWRPPGGESLREVLARARGWLDDLARTEMPDTWVAVTHAGVIRALVAAAVRWDLRPPAPLRLLPDRLHRLRRRGDGHLQLVTLNEPLLPA